LIRLSLIPGIFQNSPENSQVMTVNPHGKPSGELAKSLYEFAEYVFKETNNMIS
jgi:hypothetical protein